MLRRFVFCDSLAIHAPARRAGAGDPVLADSTYGAATTRGKNCNMLAAISVVSQRLLIVFAGIGGELPPRHD